jgi:hypothetical protein
MAAREMGGLSLADALLVCELLAKVDPARVDGGVSVGRRTGRANVGHSLNRGGERRCQEIADLLEWLKRSPALPHIPLPSDVGLKVVVDLAPGLQLPRSRKHCVRETTSCCVLLAAL